MCVHQLQVSSHDASGDKGSKKSPAVYSLKIINPNNAGGELIINDLEAWYQSDQHQLMNLRKYVSSFRSI